MADRIKDDGKLPATLRKKGSGYRTPFPVHEVTARSFAKAEKSDASGFAENGTRKATQELKSPVTKGRPSATQERKANADASGSCHY
jgi:hypothetical protein